MSDDLYTFKKETEKYFEYLKNKYSFRVELVGYDENSITASVIIIPPKTIEWIDIKL